MIPFKYQSSTIHH